MRMRENVKEKEMVSILSRLRMTSAKIYSFAQPTEKREAKLSLITLINIYRMTTTYG